MSNTKWIVDPDHSQIGFKVIHMKFTVISGFFDKYTIDVEADDDNFAGAKVKFVADTNSINTNSEERDKHLRSADFFEVKTFPLLRFTTTSVKKINDSKFAIKGYLNIRGISKEIELDAEYSGLMEDPSGDTRVAFKLSSKINRTEFGMNWNKLLAKGGLLVSEEVELICNVEFIKQ